MLNPEIHRSWKRERTSTAVSVSSGNPSGMIEMSSPARARSASTTPPKIDERFAVGRHRGDHHLAEQELDRVEVLGAFEVVRVELRADALDRIGDAMRRLRQLEVVRADRREVARVVVFRVETDGRVVVVRHLRTARPRPVFDTTLAERLAFTAVAGRACRGLAAAAYAFECLAEREHAFEAGPVGEAAHPHAVHQGRP